METYYSSSAYANYTHIHMYVFYAFFISELKRFNLDYSNSYSINVDIDGNVAIWKISANDPRAKHVFETLINNSEFITPERIQKATKTIAEKINKKFEILDSKLLLSEIKNIKLSIKKPNVKDNDSLYSPAVNFTD